MVNNATKTFLAVTIAAVVAFLAYGAVIGDKAGAELFLGLAIAAGILTAVTAAFVGADEAPHVATDAPAPERRNAYTEADVPRSSPWPLVTAIAFAGVAVGASAGGRWLTVALASLLIPGGAWLGQLWREHPSFSASVRSRVADRLIAPIAMPVLGVLGALFIAAMVSRLLLAVPEAASTAAALVVAVLVLTTLYLISARPNIRSSALVSIAALGLVALVAAGATGARAGERKFERPEVGLPIFTITAQNIKFSTDKLTLPASRRVFIKFINRDTGTYHNVAFYTSTGADRSPLFAGKPIPGGREEFQVLTPPAGTYAFVCDFHPTMTGQLVVTAK